MSLYKVKDKNEAQLIPVLAVAHKIIREQSHTQIYNAVSCDVRTRNFSRAPQD